MNLLSKLYKRSISLVIVIVIVLSVGIYFVSQMSVNLMPNFNLPFMGVAIVYPGASATMVERDVAISLEKELKKLSEVDSIQISSSNNACVAIIYYQFGVDLREKKELLKESLDKLTLPDSCHQPSIINVDLNGTALATVSVYNTSGDIFDAYSDAQILQEKFSAIEGVGSVDITGVPENIVNITPINGLELTTLLLVQSLYFDQLDIPIGQIIAQGESVLIRNMASATTLEELAAKPISLTLGNSIWTALSSANSMMTWYEEADTDDLAQLKADADDINKFIEEFESMTNQELDEMSDNLGTISSLIQLVKTNSSATLRLMWNSVIKQLVEDENFRTMTDSEIEDLAKDTNISVNTLKWVRDNSVVEDGANKSNIELYWDTIVAFRKGWEDQENALPTEDKGKYIDDNNNLLIEDSQYCPLFYDIGVVQKDDEAAEDYYTEQELTDAITLTRNINVVALNSAVQTQKDHNDNVLDDDGNVVTVSNAQYAAIFSGASGDIPVTSSMISLIRSPHFQANYQAVYDYKSARQHTPSQQEIADMIEEGITPPTYIVHSLTSTEFFELYNQLTLDGEFPVKLTEELIGFLRDTDFDKLITAANNTSTLNTTMGAVAHIDRVIEYDSMAFQGDYDALSLNVYAISGANQTRVAAQMKDIILQQNQLLDSTILMLDDQSEFITESISNVLVSMIIGGLLAIVIILLFLKDFRTAIIVGITMPLSVICAMSCLYFLGISMNMVSLGGLSVGIGMLVDNSIVVIESIALERDKGKKAFQAAVDGTKSVLSPLMASTLTSICVFFPILFTNGLTKEIFTDLSWAVIFSLSFSLLIAITIIPGLYCMIFSKKELLGGRVFDETTKAARSTKQKQPKPAKQKQPKPTKQKPAKPAKQFSLTAGVTKAIDKMLPKLLGKRWMVVLVAVVLFGSSVMLVFTTGTEFLPSVDKGRIEVDIEYADSKQVEECNKETLTAKNLIVNNISDIQYTTAITSMSNMLSTAYSGKIIVQLNSSDNTSQKVEEIRSLLHDRGFAHASVSQIDGVVAVVTNGMAGLSVSVSGDSLDKLADISNEVEQQLYNIDFVRNVNSNLAEYTTELALNIDQNQCVEQGIDYQVLVQTLYTGISSLSPSDIVLDGDTMAIRVMFAQDTLSQYYDGIQDFVVSFNSDGEAIKLQDIATIQESVQANNIQRQDGKYIVSLDIEVYNVNTGTASKTIMDTVNGVLAQPQYDGYTASESGVNNYLTDAFAGLVVSLIVSFFLLFAVMACQFESLVKPFVVIFSIPFAFTGGFVALAITAQPLSVVSFVGLIMLMGVVVNNAIIMVERIGQLVGEGMDEYTAIIEGTKSRIRPILMTTLTTITALIPIALGIGKGSDLMQSLGIVVIGGLTLSTLVTLVLIPVIYSLVKRVRPHKPTDSNNDTDDTDTATPQGEAMQDS